MNRFSSDEQWSRHLAAGDRERAWSAFLDRYRRLLVATIRQLTDDHDDTMDVFAMVCERLRENDFRRLRSFRPEDGGARFSTWLVAVVRNIAMDWYRRRDGRKRVSVVVERLQPLRRRIFECLVDRGLTYVEAYESIRGSGDDSLRFSDFLREVRELHRELRASGGKVARELIGSDPTYELAPEEMSEPEPDKVEEVQRALASLDPEIRAAVVLFVVERVPAEQVARMVGWPNAKSVYNRVYRALADLRVRLSTAGEETDAVRP